MLKIFDLNTTSGKIYSIGSFDNITGEYLKGGKPRYFKTRKGAERALKRLLGR